jgi:Fe2+ transport system protein FeoA
MVADSPHAAGQPSPTSPGQAAPARTPQASAGGSVSLTVGTPGACAGKAGASDSGVKGIEGDGCGCGPLEAARPAASEAAAVTLMAMQAGRVGRLLDAAVGADDAAMLRAMGLVPGAMVRVCRTGEPCIVAVMNAGQAASGCGCGGSRIGLAGALARAIRVVPV